MHANNRKLSEGFYRGLGLTDVEGVLREIDKLDKIGADEVAKLLVEGCGADENQARACLELAELTADAAQQIAKAPWKPYIALADTAVLTEEGTADA